MSLRLNGSTSGYVEIDAPAVAGTTSITIPATTGGQFVVTDASGNVNLDSGTLYVDAVNNRVGVGTTSPDAALHVVGAATSTQLLLTDATNATIRMGTPAAGIGILSVNTGQNLVFGHQSAVGSTYTERMRIKADGSVNIGMGANTWSSDGVEFIPTGIVQVSRSNSYSFRLNRGGSNGDVALFYRSTSLVGSISVTTTSTAYNTSSDYRLKENIVPVTDGITRLQQLKPSRFNFIADPDITVDGFLAHEVQTIVPEAVTGEKDAVDDEGNPQYQGIDQSKLVPLLTAALQEAVAKIEALETRLTVLEGGTAQ